MKTEIGQWDYCSEYLTIESARRNYCAFPIVSSALDAYPGKGKVDALQEVYSDWQLFGKAEIHPLRPSRQHGPRHSRAAE